jgi:hypothetical protein
MRAFAGVADGFRDCCFTFLSRSTERSGLPLPGGCFFAVVSDFIGAVALLLGGGGPKLSNAGCLFDNFILEGAENVKC